MFAHMSKGQETKHARSKKVCPAEQRKLPRIPYTSAPVIQRVAIEEALPVLYSCYMESAARRTLGNDEDFLVFRFIELLCSQSGFPDVGDPKTFYAGFVSPHINALVQAVRFLRNADVPVTIFELLGNYLCDYVAVGQIDPGSNGSELTEYLEEYIAHFGDVREWLCGFINNNNLDIEELYWHIVRYIVLKFPPWTVVKEDIQNVFLGCFKEYVTVQFHKESLFVSILAGFLPDYMKSVLLKAAVRWMETEYLVAVLGYLDQIGQELSCFDGEPELLQERGQKIMEYVLEETEKRIGGGNVELIGYFGQDIQMINQYIQITEDVIEYYKVFL